VPGRATARRAVVVPDWCQGVDIYPLRIYRVCMNEKPLREPAFLILTALAAGPQHGYGVIQDVSQISEGEVTLKAGTLYGVLDRLRADGLVEVEREEIISSRLRRYYRLTDSGARLLAAQARRQQRNATAAAGRLGRLGVTWTGGMA
jgi:DNA-binding PadR family transcriptional regulator